MKTLRTILILFLVSALASPAFAALSASIAWEIRATGNDTNGGFYLTGAGTDYSLSDTPLINVTDGVTNGTTTITSATANFPADCVNNGMWVSGGTGVVAPTWYQIITRTSATAVVVDRTTGLTAGTGVSLRLGGAMASLGAPVAASTADTQTFWVKSGTYTMTTTTPGAAGPVVLQTAEVVFVRGYVSTRGDGTAANIASMPVISAGAQTGITLFSAPATTAQHNISFVKVDGNAGAANIGFSFGSNCPGLHRLLDAINCPGTAGFVGSTTLYECRAVANAIGFSGSVQNLFGCSAIGNTSHGCANTGGGVIVDFLGHGNGGDGINGSTHGLHIFNPTTDGNTGDGIDLASNRCTIVNPLSTNNGGFGINLTSATTTPVWNHASFANGARYNTSPSVDINPVLVLVDPYVTLASDDFRPNTAATGGALLRAVGSGPFGQTNNNDIGAVQHTDPTGGPARLINGGLIR